MTRIGTGIYQLFQKQSDYEFWNIPNFFIIPFIYIYIWWFPEIGVPLKIIHFRLGFYSDINQPFGGTPIYGNPHIGYLHW